MKVYKSICLLVCLLLSQAAASSSIEIIIHPDNQQQDITYQSLRAIFTMRWQTWENGTPIQVYVLNDSDNTHIEFSKQLIGVFPHQLRKAWNRLVFSGTGQAPIEVSTQQEMLNKVSQVPGAIGYITLDNINESVKTIPLK